jgi:hypothetical protein
MVKLIAAGCSWTQGFLEDKSYPWPELLAKKLDMECINLGQGGAGNEYISSVISDKVIEEKDIGLAVVMWSNCFRLDFDIFNDNGYGSSHIRGWLQIHHKRFTDYVKSWYKRSDFSANGATKRLMRLSYSFQNLMEKNNIPYIQVQGKRPIHFVDKETYHRYVKECANSIIDSPYFHKIDENKFIGWPIMSEIGGECMDDILDEETEKYKDHDHPNEFGQERIAEFLYKNVV